EPLGMLAEPRVVGRALNREVERDLEPELPRLLDERPEVVERAELRVDGVVSALLAADRPRAAGIAGQRVQDAVAALPCRGHDQMDGREVHDVEAELGELGQHARDTPEAAKGAREELVPGAEACELSVDVDLERPRERRRLRAILGRRRERRLEVERLDPEESGALGE